MNSENISALVGQLQSLGFENSGYLLLKRISFKPDNFTLSQNVDKGKDKLMFQLFFEKDSKQNSYALMYYDASLQKETTLSDITINGINTTNIEKYMAEIDWKTAFDFNTRKPLSFEDKTSWEKEQKVESVVESLSELEKSEDGKAISIGLKLKYWAGIPYQELFGNISPLKNKLEVSQRFYFFDGQIGISIDEAHRFLQNRWLEKQMQAKKKQSDESTEREIEYDTNGSSGNGQLRKKRITRSHGNKKLKSNQG